MAASITMSRRTFARAGLAASLATTLARTAHAAPTATRTFEVITRIDLAATGTEAAQLWLPLFATDRSYQRDLGVRIEGSGNPRTLRAPASGAPMLHAAWQPGDSDRTLTVIQRVATWERAAAPARLSHTDRARFTAATPLIPTDGLARETARRIVGSINEPRAQVRAIYDWMVANTWRDPATPGCGAGDVATLLREQRLAGKCVDLSRLFVALVRAVGIPAREVYGLRLAPSALFKSLGRAGNVTGAQHCRAEVWFDDAPGRGAWFACDPADVRKAVLEEKLPVDSAPIQALAQRLFGQWESNWAGYNHAGALALPGATLPPRYDFLMYPTAMTRTALCNCLDPKSFAYTITSREIAA